MRVYKTRCLVARPTMDTAPTEDWLAPLREQASVFELMSHVEATPSSKWVMSVASVCTTERFTGRHCRLFYYKPLRVFERRPLNPCMYCKEDPCDCLPF